MSQGITSETFQIGGMTCTSCERRIQTRVLRLPGVESAEVSYSKGTGKIVYNSHSLSRCAIIQAIESLDYTVCNSKTRDNAKGANNMAGILLIILALYILLRQSGLLNLFNVFPQAEAGMEYGMLFVIGVLTSVHCVAMCGGINLSQCIPAAVESSGKWASLRPSFLYNLGRVISYTAVGGIVGALGSVISFSGAAKGIVQLAAGVFMVIMGINMLGIFPWLRRFNPRLPGFLTRGVQEKKKSNSPLVVGLLNGLMPCGPLQAMQLYALSTGDPVKGALSMLLFSLGTVPLMFGLGALSSILSKKFTSKMMTVGAVLVVLLGVSMFNNGLALSGFAVPTGGGGENTALLEDGVQIVNMQLTSGRYEPITVTTGIPVRWTITAEPGTVNGCNNRMIIQEYGIEKSLEIGVNIIEFTPTKSGTFRYSCWMGMIRNTITVTESDGTVPDMAIEDDPYGAYDGYDYFNYPEISQPDPVPAGYVIPTDSLAVAQIQDEYTQVVSIDVDDERFQPAVIVMQYGLEAEWIINNNNTTVEALNFPLYYTLHQLISGENLVYLLATDDFDFSTEDNAFYGYVKVVEDIGNFDQDAILQEVSEYVTYISNFSYSGFGGGASCH